MRVWVRMVTQLLFRGPRAAMVMKRPVATVLNEPVQIRTDPHQSSKREAKDQISRSDLPPKLHFRYSWRTVGLFMCRADAQDEIIRSK